MRAICSRTRAIVWKCCWMNCSLSAWSCNFLRASASASLSCSPLRKQQTTAATSKQAQVSKCKRPSDQVAADTDATGVPHKELLVLCMYSAPLRMLQSEELLAFVASRRRWTRHTAARGRLLVRHCCSITRARLRAEATQRRRSDVIAVAAPNRALLELHLELLGLGDDVLESEHLVCLCCSMSVRFSVSVARKGICVY